MATLVLESSAVWCKYKGDRELVCDGDGECKVGGLCTSLDRRDRWLQQGTGGVWLLGLRKWGVQSEDQNRLLLALKQGNVGTFGATSRRYRED